MSLDLVIFGADGRPERRVGIGVEQHAELMAQVSSLGLALLGRLEDYYEDATFSVEELPALAVEVSKVQAMTDSGSGLASLLPEVLGLVTFARAERREVEALAD